MNEAPLEAGRRLFAKSCDFILSAADRSDVPTISLPEVAFAGRSNVGKSSLINALTGRRTLARISNTPGRTRLLNFFNLGDRLILVDLPGYGYARAPRGDIKAWTKLTRAYLAGRPNLRRVCLLIDARHGLKPADREIMTVLDDTAVNYQIVLTKTDKVRPADLDRRIAAIRDSLSTHIAAHPDILTTSAMTGAGIPELRAELATLAAPDELG